MPAEQEPQVRLGNNKFGEELALMRRGEKLMASFCIDALSTEAEALVNQNFQPDIEAGRMTRFDSEHTSEIGDVKHVIFTLAGEEWRAKAYILLLNFLYTKGWTPELQWMEARLFGLSDRDAKAVVRTYLSRQDGTDDDSESEATP